VSRFTNYPFHLPREHVPKLLIHLSEVSPVRCGRFEFDTRLAIVERSLRIADDVVSARHPDFDLCDSETKCGGGSARLLVAQLISAIVADPGIPLQEICIVMYKQRMSMIIQPLP